MTLLIQCFCVVKQGHRFTGKQRKVRPEWQAGSTLIQGQGQTHHSDTGHILIHLVMSLVHLLISIYGSSHSPLVLLLYSAQWSDQNVNILRNRPIKTQN